MSVNVERKELVDIARSLYNGKLDIEEKLKLALTQKNQPFLKKMEKKLWDTIVRDHPWKDFTGSEESKTRSNIVKRIRTVIKGKFF